ncbi:MAG: GDSL-type esterase/lipase family protein [Victivallaceae bacterium]
MKNYMLFLLVSSLLLLYYSNPALAATKNLINNPGVEKSIGPWSAPAYWSGTVSFISDSKLTHSGAGCMKLVAAEKNGKHWGRIYQASKAENFVGRHFRYSMWVKGKGELALGVIEYILKKNKDSIFFTNVKLTGEWQKITCEFTVEDPKVSMLSALAEVRGKGSEVYIDDVSLTTFQDPTVAIEAQQKHQIVAQSSLLPDLSFELSKSEKTLSQAPVTLYLIFPDGSNKIIKSVTNSTGLYSSSPENITLDSPGVCQAICSMPESGVISEIYIDVIDKSSYAKMDSIAKEIKLQKPLHILYLGDSLTDHCRGHNYVDKLDYWLNKYNQDKVSFRNAGVGGDFITRMWERIQGIEGNKKAYRQNMYDGLFDKKTDIVFIFLGHNDTKADSNSGYKTPVVEPKIQEETYRKLIKYIRSKSDAKIVLLSSSSSFFPRCKAIAEKQAAMGKKHVLFGQPEKLEAFNDVVKKLSHELHLDYIDIYNPTKNHPDKANLFSPNDGIHLTEKGNSFIAMLLLNYISSVEHKTNQ